MVADSKLEQRVIRAAEAALSDRHYVSPVDVLVGLGWLAPRRIEEWRQVRLESLESAVDLGPEKISTAIRAGRAGY